MTSKSRDLGAFVMVSLEREDETVSKIMEILELQGFPDVLAYENLDSPRAE